MFPATGAHGVGPAAATAAMIFGLVLAGLGVALRSVRREAAPATAATRLILLPWQARAEVSALAQHTPYLGTVFAVAGRLVAVVGAVSARRR